MQYRVRFSFFALPTTAPPRRGHGDDDGWMPCLALFIVAGAATGAVNAAVDQWIGIPRASAGQATGAWRCVLTRGVGVRSVG